MAEPSPGFYNEVFDISRVFSRFINNNYNIECVINQLSRLDQVLENYKEPFLTGNELAFCDIFLFVRLYCLQVVLKYFKNFTIPENMKRINNLLSQLYSQQVIRSSCPADQDIIKQYSCYNQMRIPLSEWKFLNQVCFSFEN
ncbi:chloride intracellular channel exl-1-like [Octopus sinensis]|uniref:Chloride intracellular channel exl-1-like n=1 Tax=Octopus sinensis TaxID=2607531 RepID=A0A6P7TYS4_9MOLL|nr:chloride intracellular channel exl-1-like [Octopus sinensis]